MTILVTGANGLIGRHLVPALSSSNEVVAPSRVHCDLSTPDFLKVLPARADTVVHLAQSVHYQDFPARADDIFAVNVGSTARLLDWSVRAGVSRFILASAGGADRPAVPGRPSFYLGTKRSAELLAESYRGHFAVTVLRFFFVYGPGQRSAMLVPRLIDNVRHGRPITLAGQDGIRINPVHVNDAAAAVARAATADLNRTLDIAGPDTLTMRAIGELLGAKLRRVPVFAVDPAAVGDDLVGDTGAMREHLVAPTRRFESGVDDLLADGEVQ